MIRISPARFRTTWLPPSLFRFSLAGFSLAGFMLAGCSLALAAAAEPDSRIPEDEPPPLVDFVDTAAGLAPAGIDVARPLAADQWRLSYRYIGTWQNGNRIGSEAVDAVEALRARSPSYERVPTERDTAIHMLGIDWSPHSRVTLVLRLPVVSIEEERLLGVPAGAPARASSDGIGDLSFGVSLPFMRKGEEVSSLSLMLRAPTGSVRERGSDGARLAFPLQLGVGSWTVSPGLNYAGRDGDLFWGGQVGASFTLNENSLNWQPGTAWHLSSWFGWRFGDVFSTSLRTAWSRWSNIGGLDAGQPMPFTSPTQNPTLQRGQRVDIGPGINLRLPCCAHQHIAVEALFPLWQDLNGPQLGNSWVLNASWRITL